MRKFDETLLENQNWKEIGISGKWAPVVIESPYRITYEDTVSMIMRNDYLFSYSEYSGGNDRYWNCMLRDYARLPQRVPHWVRISNEPNEEEKEFWTKAHYLYDEEYKKICKSWNRNPAGDLDSQVFSVNLFSSAYIGGPYSFVNFSTGEVGLIHNLGKYPSSVGNCAEELEWFAKTYPNYKFFVTFCDDECNYTPLVTLMLWNGEIKVVTTRTKEDWEYVAKINHLKGSTCAKNSILREKFWKFIFYFGTKKHRLIEKFFDSKFAEKYLLKIKNERIIQHNDRITFGMDGEKYFDRAHAIGVIDDWLDYLREKK